jgi:hypothetical protein
MSCTITNVKAPPQNATLIVITHVDNSFGGGTKQASDFTNTVTGNSPSPSTFQGSESGNHYCFPRCRLVFRIYFDTDEFLVFVIFVIPLLMFFGTGKISTKPVSCLWTI